MASTPTAGDVDAATVAKRPWELYGPRERRAFLAILFLVCLSNYVDRNIIGVLLEPIKAEFGVSDTLLGLLSGFAFAAFYATLGIPVAQWADRGDRKFILTLSLAVWSGMTALCGLAGSFWQLAAARFGVGAGEAGAIPPSQSLLADYYPPTERARAIGIFMMAGSLAYAVALILGGWITEQFGWRVAFVVVGASGLLLLPLTHLVLKEPRRLPAFAMRPGESESALGAARALLAKRSYRYILAGLVGYFLVAYGAMVFIVSLMIRVHGLGVSRAGLIFGTVSALGAAAGNLAGGALGDRMARRDIASYPRLAGWSMMLATPCYAVAFAAPDLSIMVAALVFAMLLMWGAAPSMFAALHVVCGSKRRAMAVAVAFLFANLIGLGLGPLITGSLSDAFAATRGSGEGLRLAMLIVVTTFLPAGWLMHRSARHLAADAED